SHIGLRPQPFYLGIAYAVSGLFLSFFLVRETRHHVAREIQLSAKPSNRNHSAIDVFLDTTVRDKNLSSVTQAGFANNLNDGMAFSQALVLLSGLFSRESFLERGQQWSIRLSLLQLATLHTLHGEHLQLGSTGFGEIQATQLELLSQGLRQIDLGWSILSGW